MACLLKVRQDGFVTALDDRQTESMVGALSRGAISASIFTICLAAFLFAALHIYLL
ncbi:thiol:disulfide interchange protein [Paraburkholderia sp. JPY465]